MRQSHTQLIATSLVISVDSGLHGDLESEERERAREKEAYLIACDQKTRAKNASLGHAER